MRFIDINEFRDVLPKKWSEKADKLTTKLSDEYARNTADAASRSQIINGNALWAGLRQRIASVRKGKCWYCESVITRSPMPVDHYRPKGAVAGCDGHSGYWWLAYEWSNYRFCCTYCNSIGTKTRSVAGGKGTHFPIEDEKQRGTCPTDDLSKELPLLLDPTNAADPPLLWFSKSGEAIPHPRRCGTDPATFPHRRASTSIRIYNLNEDDIRERRGLLCKQVEGDALSADKYYARYLDGDGTAHMTWEDCLRRLFRAVDKNAEYSMAARATLAQLRHKSETAATVLEQAPG